MGPETSSFWSNGREKGTHTSGCRMLIPRLITFHRQNVIKSLVPTCNVEQVKGEKETANDQKGRKGKSRERETIDSEVKEKAVR